MANRSDLPSRPSDASGQLARMGDHFLFRARADVSAVITGHLVSLGLTTRKERAEYLGVSGPQMSRIEGSPHDITLDKLLEIAGRLGFLASLRLQHLCDLISAGPANTPDGVFTLGGELGRQVVLGVDDAYLDETRRTGQRGVSDEHIYEMIANGELEATRTEDGRLAVTEAAVQQYKQASEDRDRQEEENLKAAQEQNPEADT